MALSKIIDNYFNPNCPTKQLGEDEGMRDFYGIAGIVVLGTATVAHFFFNANRTTTAIVAASGAGLIASYSTRKHGYAALVGLSLLSGASFAAVDAICSGRVFVQIDIAGTIREMRLFYLESQRIR